MNAIREEIKNAVEKEKAHAEDVYGLYASFHEKYGVMFEELQEVEEELRNVRDSFDRMWRRIRVNNENDAKYQAMAVAISAENLAAEAVQLAAAARKQLEEDYLPKGAEVSE